MTRHLVLALGLALVASATALLLADVGVFAGLEQWLFERYRSEALWKGLPGEPWAWLPATATAIGALLVAWVAVDMASWSAKLAVLTAALGAAAFLSLTLAFYGMAFSPWSALTAAVLAFAMGCALAETPSGRARKETEQLLGRRTSEATLQLWATGDLTPPWRDPGVREGAVVAVRILSPMPPAETIGLHLDERARLSEELARLLRTRPGVILDLPSNDGVRAFFGFRPDAAGGDLEAAAHAALEIATFLKDEAALQSQAGVPPLTWGLGVSLGPLVIGRHGPESERIWTASGTPAEQARQLAALNARHHTAILVGRRAADSLGARFELRAVEGDAIHALIAAKSAAPSDDFPLTASEPDLPTDLTDVPGERPASGTPPGS